MESDLTTKNPSETNKKSQSKQTLLLFLHLLEEDLGTRAGAQERGVMCNVESGYENMSKHL